MNSLDQDTKTKIEAAVFRRLMHHFQDRTDVQNIDLMNLADFCRNCLSKWYVAAAQDEGIELDYEEVRTEVYGMPYANWKKKYQTEMTPQQKVEFEKRTRQKK